MRGSPCAKKSRESVVAETRAFCRTRPREFRLDPSLPNSHHSSFLEGIVLQEPAWWPSGLRPQASARQAGRQAVSSYCLLVPPPPPPPPPPPVPSPELLPKSPGLTFARSGGGEVRTIHSAGPRSIAPFKCRKLSGQVGAFDFASSFSLMNGSVFILSPISPPLGCPLQTAGREGGRELRDGRRLCEKQAFHPSKRCPLLFLTQETPLHHLRIMDIAWKQMMSSLEIFLRRRTERRASVSLLCWPVLKSLEFKIINRAWRHILGRPTLEPNRSLL